MHKRIAIFSAPITQLRTLQTDISVYVSKWHISDYEVQTTATDGTVIITLIYKE